MIETLHVSDIFLVASLRIAQHNKHMVDVVSDEGETFRGRVQSITETNGFVWIVKVERDADHS